MVDIGQCWSHLQPARCSDEVRPSLSEGPFPDGAEVGFEQILERGSTPTGARVEIDDVAPMDVVASPSWRRIDCQRQVVVESNGFLTGSVEPVDQCQSVL